MKQDYLFFVFFFISLTSFSQNIQINGVVYDAQTKEPLPFVNVYPIHHTEIGTHTDEKGFYSLNLADIRDSLQASYIGYESQTLPVTQNPQQSIHFYLAPSTESLNEIIITAKKYKEPEFEVLENIMLNKKNNDRRSIPSYKLQKYNRLAAYIIDNEEGLAKSKMVKKMAKVAKDYKNELDENGNLLIPILINESITENYFSSHSQREIVTHNHLSGIGLEGPEALSSILNSGQFYDYNFYKNQVNILNKYFTSPIADGWKSNYNYKILDTVKIDTDFCIVLEVEPKRPQELAFRGKIWVTQKEYALKKLDLAITENANINYIKGLSIRQNHIKTEAGPWIPQKTEFELKIDDFLKILPSITAKCTTINNQFALEPENVLNTLDENKNTKTEKSRLFWSQYQDSLSWENSLKLNQSIQEMNNISSVKSYSKLIKVLSTGYLETKYIDLGFLGYFYLWNDIEGHRPGFAFRTNESFSKKWHFNIYGAYGTQDDRWKYDFILQHVISEKKFTKIGLAHIYELTPSIFLGTDIPAQALFRASNLLFTVSDKKPFYSTSSKFWVESKLSRSITQKIEFRNIMLEPVYNFAYRYDQDSDVINEDIHITEVMWNAKIQKGGKKVRLKDLSEMSIGADVRPTFNFWAIFGIKGLEGSQFEYQKFYFDVTKENAKIWGIGQANYTINGGYIHGKLPYPLLKIHQGNNTPFIFRRSFNQMNGFEFVSDHFIGLHYAHFFDGYILNKIPLFKRLNKVLDWRLLFTTNMVYGGMSEENKNLLFDDALGDRKASDVYTLRYDTPYIEVGLGIDNILKFFRVDFIQRLTYLDHENTRPFGIKFAAEIKF